VPAEDCKQPNENGRKRKKRPNGTSQMGSPKKEPEVDWLENDRKWRRAKVKRSQSAKNTFCFLALLSLFIVNTRLSLSTKVEPFELLQMKQKDSV
jgi:hypothetical protein